MRFTASVGADMATTKIFITRTETERAIRKARDVSEAKRKGEKHPESGMAVLSDMSLKGLRLINVGGVASWVLKTEKHTKTLGYLYPPHDKPLTAPDKAREIAGYVKQLLIADPDRVDTYLDAWHVHKDHNKAMAALVAKADTWTFEECIKQMLSDRQKPDSTDVLKPLSVKDVNTAFNRPVFDKIKKTPAVALARADFEKARDEVREKSGISPAIKVVAWSRSVFDWMVRHHSGQSGVDGKDPWWELLHAPYKVKAKTRRPEVSDIVRSLILAEQYLDKPLPGRAIATAGVGAGVLAGLWWIVLTCQRGDAALSLRTYNLVDDEQRGEGWKIAAWEAGQMKAGVAQMLPIPPRAANILDQLRKRAKNHGSQAWCFPSDRDDEKHATVSGVYRILYRLAGKDTLVQKAKEPKARRLKNDGSPRKLPERTSRQDLLKEAGIDWWSGHDVRRTLQMTLDNAGIPGGASVILAHEMKSDINLTVSMSERQRDDFMKNRVAHITSAAYGAAQYPRLKAEAMRIWTDLVLDEYERQKHVVFVPS